jgi:hypothetical protein
MIQRSALLSQTLAVGCFVTKPVPGGQKHTRDSGMRWSWRSAFLHIQRASLSASRLQLHNDSGLMPTVY